MVGQGNLRERLSDFSDSLFVSGVKDEMLSKETFEEMKKKGVSYDAKRLSNFLRDSFLNNPFILDDLRNETQSYAGRIGLKNLKKQIKEFEGDELTYNVYVSLVKSFSKVKNYLSGVYSKDSFPVLSTLIFDN